MQFITSAFYTIKSRDLPTVAAQGHKTGQESLEESQELEPPPATQPSLKRRRLEALEKRESTIRSDIPQDEDIYGASRFGGYGEYMRRKRAKLQIQNTALRDSNESSDSGIFRGLSIYVSVELPL
jgi:DNA repair protein REV1